MELSSRSFWIYFFFYFNYDKAFPLAEALFCFSRTFIAQQMRSLLIFYIASSFTFAVQQKKSSFSSYTANLVTQILFPLYFSSAVASREHNSNHTGRRERKNEAASGWVNVKITMTRHESILYRDGVSSSTSQMPSL
jgi:hypothetical protein